jgi:SH3 domain-containing YSC84-like protein 1
MLKRRILGFAVVVLVAGWSGATPVGAQSGEESRVNDAATVFAEIMSAPDGGVPRSVLDKAEAIAIFPGVFRAGFALGGQYGHGIISVRDRKTGTWSAPAFLKIAGGSFGLQLGAQAIDIVLVIMDPLGVQRLLSNEFKIGGEASAAAGPVGRAAEASTDIQMRAKILSYSRSRGLFAGVAVNGSTLTADTDANERFYGQRYDSRGVIRTASASAALPPAVATLRKTLAKYAG